MGSLRELQTTEPEALPVWAIVLICIAAAVVLALLIWAVVYCCKRSKRRSEQRKTQETVLDYEREKAQLMLSRLRQLNAQQACVHRPQGVQGAGPLAPCPVCFPETAGGYVPAAYGAPQGPPGYGPPPGQYDDYNYDYGDYGGPPPGGAAPPAAGPAMRQAMHPAEMPTSAPPVAPLGFRVVPMVLEDGRGA